MNNLFQEHVLLNKEHKVNCINLFNLSFSNVWLTFYLMMQICSICSILVAYNWFMLVVYIIRSCTPYIVNPTKKLVLVSYYMTYCLHLNKSRNHVPPPHTPQTQSISLQMFHSFNNMTWTKAIPEHGKFSIKKNMCIRDQAHRLIIELDK
jgi:hypothetical protein